MQKTSKKNKQINIRTSQEVYDALEFEAKKRGITITDLCCQGVDFLIANLHSKQINEALKKGYGNEVSETLQGIQDSLSLSLDFEMSKLQELENRVSNIERALVRVFGVISDQSQSILSNDNQEQSSDGDSENSKETSKTDENSPDSVEQNPDITDESKNSGFRKSKRGGEVEASTKNATSVKRGTPKTDKSGGLTHCPHCHSSKISKNGHDRYSQQMYRCKNCKKITTLNQKTLGWI